MPRLGGSRTQVRDDNRSMREKSLNHLRDYAVIAVILTGGPFLAGAISRVAHEWFMRGWNLFG